MKKFPESLLDFIRADVDGYSRLVFRDVAVTDLDIQRLCEAMQTNTHVVMIDISLSDPDQSQLTSLSARHLSQLRIENLMLRNHSFGDDGAAFLARAPYIKRLSVTNCGFSLNGARAFLSNQSIQMFLIDYASDDRTEKEELERQLYAVGKRNRENENDCENHEKNLQELAMRAIDKDAVVELIPLVSGLLQGPNTFLIFGCSLLQYCVDKNSPRCAHYLLNAGASIESQVFDYTPLFVAAENGRFELVQLFLAYGGNLTGEFYFNQEEALSISASKLCESVFGLIETHPQFKETLSRTERARVESFVRAWQACVDKHTGKGEVQSDRQYERDRNSLSGNFRTFADILAERAGGGEPRVLDFTQQPPTAMWLQVSENIGLKYGAAMAATEVLGYLQRFAGADPNKKEAFDRAISHSKIYRLLRQKEFIIKPTQHNQISLNDYTQAKNYCSTAFKVSVPEQNTRSQRLSETELKKALESLSQDIRSHGYTAVDWSHQPRLFVAEFRGVHYTPAYFTPEQQKDHATTCHLNRMAPAPAVIMMTGNFPRQQQTSRESELESNRYLMLDTFAAFEQSGPTRLYGKEFANESDGLQERMSDQYNFFRQDIAAQANPPATVLYNLNAMGYPHCASSDLPYDAALYGFGYKGYQNAIYGAQADRTAPSLDPEYDMRGKPQRHVLGKIYISLFTPESLHWHHMRDVVGMHNDGRVRVREMIVVERERSAPGGIMQHCMFYEAALMVPDFSLPYGPHVQHLFGLSEEQYLEYRKKFSSVNSVQARYQIVKDHLFKKIAEYLSVGLLKMAMDEARQRGGYLVFARSDGTFDLRPQHIQLTNEKLRNSVLTREYNLFLATRSYQFRSAKDEDPRAIMQPWQYRDKVFGSITGTSRTNLAATFQGREIFFDIFQTLGDGACGFYSLPIPFDRTGVVNLLLSNAQNPRVRELTAEEIMEQTISQSIPEALRRLHPVFARYVGFMAQIDRDRQALLSNVLDQLGRQHFSANDFDSVLAQLKIDPLRSSAAEQCLDRLVQFDQQYKTELVRFRQGFSAENVFRDFVQQYLGGNGWLSFAREGLNFARQTSCLDAILLVMRPPIRLYIWQDEPLQQGRLKLVYSGGPDEGTPTHIHHAGGAATHFSLMAESQGTVHQPQGGLVVQEPQERGESDVKRLKPSAQEHLLEGPIEESDDCSSPNPFSLNLG